MDVFDLLRKFKSCGLKNLVIADIMNLDLTEEHNSVFEISSYYDARSAGFYALGLSQSIQEPVIVLVENSYVDNLYTSMTEAWFQHVPIIYVVVDNTAGYDYNIYKRCTRGVFDVRSLCQTEEITILKSGPSLFICNHFGEHDRNMLDEKRMEIAKLIPQEINIYLPEDSYGALSKYAGRITSLGKDEICIIPASWLKRDMNIFNNRYTKDKLKIILLEDENIDYFNDWLQANHINVMHGNGVDVISELLISKDSAVLIYNL